MKPFNKFEWKHGSIKWKIFASFVFFIAFVILLLWLFQVFFLEEFYMYVKGNAVKDAARQINAIVNNESYITQVQTIAKENDFCVGVYENDVDDIGNLSLQYASNKDDIRCRISDARKNEAVITNLQEEVKKKGTSASKLLENKDNFNQRASMVNEFNKNPFPDNFGNVRPNNFQQKIFYNMTYISVVKGTADNLKTIIIDAQLTPVNATIDTIQYQFAIIALILIIVASGLAFYLSRKIAVPIINMNESAKGLAEGNYEVEFKGDGYQEIKELNDTLHHAAIELSKVDKLRKELIANMSHDLRTPLTMISGYGEVMRDIPGENTPENVQIIIDETIRLTTLVNDMLDLSKLQAGAMVLQQTEFDITQEILNVIQRYDKLLSNQPIQIHYSYDEHIWVKGDIVKLNQAVYNLINNAINYCGEDHLILVKQKLIDDMVCFEFIDHGEGMEEDQLPYIWDRYYKVDKTHTRSKVGSGLGLSIVKTVLDMHKAGYGVKSKVGKGTIFWFTLPILRK